MNPDFVDRWAGTPEKLLMLVMHELHHILLGHTRFFPCVTPVDNLVFDAVINALLCRMFPQEEHVRFFTDFYDDSKFPACLLRPPENWSPGRKPGCRRRSSNRGIGRFRTPTGPSIPRRGPATRNCTTPCACWSARRTRPGIPLIGDHSGGGENGSSEGRLEHRSPVVFEAVRQIVERWPQPPNPITGRSLADLLRESTLRPVRRRTSRRFCGGFCTRQEDRPMGTGKPSCSRMT